MVVQDMGALGASVAALLARLRAIGTSKLLRSYGGDALAISVLTIVSAWVYSLALREPISSDDCSYFEYASGLEISGLHHKQRVAVVGSTMLAQALFGLTPTAYYAVSAFYSTGLIIAIYLATRTLVGVLPAMLAALLWLGNPVFLGNMTLLLPDIPALFWFFLGTAVALRAFLRDTQVPDWQAAVAGFALFLCVASKESMVTLLPGMLLMPVMLRNNPKRWRFFLILAGSVLAFELLQTLSYWILKGDPLHRLHAVTGDHVQRMHGYSKDRSAMPQNIDWAHLTTRFFELNERTLPAKRVAFWGAGYWSWVSWSSLAAIAIAALRRDLPVLTLASVMLLAWATLTFSVVSLDPLIPMVRTKSRYFMVVSVFWGPLLVSAAARALAHYKLKLRPWGFAAAITSLTSVALWFATTFVADHAKNSRHLVRNGATQVRDVGKTIQRIVRSGVNVKRAIGRSRPLRAGGVLWTSRNFEIKRTTRKSTKFLPGDLFISKEPFHGWTSQELSWREVGRGAGHHYLYFFEGWDEPLRAGSVRIYSNHSSQLRKQAGSHRQRLWVTLEAKAEGARPKSVVFLIYRNKGAPKRKSLKWKRKDDRYLMHTKTPAYDPTRIRGVALDLKVSGGGTLRLIRKEITPEPG